jgi:signal transduction histidine kinase
MEQHSRRQSSQWELPRLAAGDSTVAAQAEGYGQVIRLISHDLRNPLTAVQLNAQLIERAAIRDGREPDQRWASLIVAAVRRLDSILQQLAEAERLRSGRTKLALTPLAFDLFLREFLAGAGPEFDANRVRVTLRKATLAVCADRARLGQAILHLLRLALQHAALGSSVMVEVLGSEGEVSCMIRVPTTTEVTVDEPINGRAGERQCDGIALYVARTLIECHGGRLQVTDRTGVAIAFEVVLPAVRE